MFVTRRTALNSNVVTVCRKFEEENKDLLIVLRNEKDNIRQELFSQIKRMKSLKWYISVKVQFSKTTLDEGIEVLKTATFRNAVDEFLISSDFESKYNEAVNKIHESKSKFVQEGSAWTLEKVEEVCLNIVRYKPLFAASYIPTPPEIRHSSYGILNIQNKDSKCFLWSVLAKIYPTPQKTKYRVGSYKRFETKLNTEGLNFPISVDEINRFEDCNRDVSINVFRFENKDLSPLRITKHKNRTHHVNLLFLTAPNGQSHYCLITDLSKLCNLLTQSKRNIYCNYCLVRFECRTSFDDHISHCESPNTLPVKISSNGTFIATPKFLSRPGGNIINIYSPTDNKSFAWSVLARLIPDITRTNLVTYYKQFENVLNMEGIEYPVHPKSLDKFESQNTNISVNVFGFEGNEIYPVRITKEKVGRIHVNLLLLTNDNGDNHYCLITDLSQLLKYLTKHKDRSFYCDYCLHRFSGQDLLTNHLPYCEPHGAQKTRLPSNENDKFVCFTNYTLQHKTPYAIYCDFESFVRPIAACDIKPGMSSTRNIAKHEPSGFSYIIVGMDGTAIKPPVVYDGPNVIDTFLNSLLSEADELVPKLKVNIPLVMSQEDETSFKNANDCHLCKKTLNEDRVRNHDHLSGKFLGAAHNTCNQNYKVPQHIPVFFHNFQGYDSHLLMEGVGKIKNRKISCIAKSSERYMSLNIGPLRILDSLQFLSAPLDTLVENLVKDDPSKFRVLRQCMGDDKANLLLRKGVFPYAYFTDESKFDETSLPPKEEFFNDLTKTHISDADYEYAKQIWSTFDMKTFREYHNLYLLTDTILLACIFENFREMSMKYYELDPCNFYSAPGLAWMSMIKMSNVKLELLTDVDQYNMIENAVRGGVSMISNRYVRANNPLLTDYDQSKPVNYLVYFDANNLYALALRDRLPHSGFRWLSSDEISRLDITKVSDDSENGYILEVDLEYPEHLHDMHNDFPLAPEKTNITEDMLSPHAKTLLSELNMKPGKVKKLLTTLNNKTKYTVHYKTLKLYLELGLILKKVHRILTFKQSAWMRPFIDFNTQKRKDAKNSFEKDFFKLINNSTFGRSLLNVRKFTDFKLINSEKKLVKETAKPRMTNFTVFNEDLVGVELKRSNILLNHPIYAGFSVLDLSKHTMYNFYYNWAVKKYGGKVKLCMTDTDSLLMSIQTADVYADIKDDLHLFDTSEYPTDHPCYSEANKKKLGVFKDELKSKPIVEFAGLRPKCYSILDLSGDEKKVAKGVPRTAIKQQLVHKQFIDCIFRKIGNQLTTASLIRSDKHQIYTQLTRKVSLSAFDDKRFLINDVDSLAYGHVRTREYERNEDLDTLVGLLDTCDVPPTADVQSPLWVSDKDMDDYIGSVDLNELLHQSGSVRKRSESTKSEGGVTKKSKLN